MPGAEMFTVMAILDAQDRASTIFERVSGVVERFAGIMNGAAADAEAAGAVIDRSLLQTASGADALALANDRVEASTAKLNMATERQAIAEQQLMDVRARGLGMAELAAAGDALAKAERDAAVAAAELSAAQEVQQATARTLTATNEELAASEEAVAAGATGWIGVAVAAAAATAGIGAFATKVAGDFQSAAVHLTTDAGESADKLKMVSDGMLQIAADTGTSAETIAQGMYHIESAGYHGAAGLDMMRIAAEGAKVGNAKLETVSKTLAGTLDSYKEKGYTATQMMDMLIETTAAGDLRMQDLASSLGKVTPIAAAAGMEFSQVGGAIATMTAQNMTAQQATQNLTNLLVHLQKPNDVQIKQMQQMGIDSNDLSSRLGERGLTGTLAILVDAVDKSQKEGGKFSSVFRDSTAAAHDAQVMLSTFSGAQHKLAQDFMDGKVSAGDYTKAIKDLPAGQHEAAKEFGNLVDKMGSFNTLLASGKPEAQTFNAELANLTGGQIGLRTALMLSIDQSRYFNEATAKIQEAADHAGNSVKNWDAIQGTFNQKVEEAKAQLDVLGIKIGTMIIPYVEKIVGVMAKAAEWFAQNKLVVEALATALGVMLGAALIVIGVLAAVAVGALVVLGLIIMGLVKAAEYAWKGIVWAWNGIVDGAKWLWGWMVKIYNAIANVVIGAWNWISDVTSSVWNAIAGFFKKWWPLLYAVFATPIFAIQAMWHRFHEDIEAVVVPIWDSIKSAMSAAWDWLKSTAKSAWNLIHDYIVDPFMRVYHAVESIQKSINDAISSGINWVLDFLSGIGKSFESVGKGIVDGIWHGIKYGWNWLMDQISNLAESLLKSAKDAIGVKSPSRKFADEFGKWIPYGIAAGIDEHSHIATNAMTGLSNSLQAKVSMGTGISPMGGGFGDGGGGSTVIIDMRGSHLMTDRDMDVFVDKVGRQLAIRALPAGGVRIRS